VQTYVTRLRAVLGAELIGTRPNGYVLHAEPDQVDALRFLRLVDAADAAPDVRAERIRLEEALTLWRGMPFEGLRSGWLADLEAPRLVERYLTAVERRADLDLAARRPGRPGEVAVPLVQPAEAVAAGLPGSSPGPAINPSSDIDM
jgi:transcriptional activator